MSTVAFPSGAELLVVDGAGDANPLLDAAGPARDVRLSEHFSVGELARSGAEPFATARIDPRLVAALQRLRDHIARPVHVTSGYRPSDYNASLYDRYGRAAPASRHSTGEAADVAVDGMSGAEIADVANGVLGSEVRAVGGRDHAHIELEAAPSGGRWIVLVAGFDYEQKGVDFEKLARNRIRLLVRRHEAAERVAKAPLAHVVATAPRFLLFDFASGRVRRATATRRATWTWTDVATFDPVGPANYSVRADGRHAFDTNQAGTLSITDVYAKVREIGRTEPGSLGELAFLSHGWMGGPILVNSWDGVGDATSDRDANDKDARIWKDFVAPTMDDAARAEFAAAFATDAHVWVFGCAFANGPRQLMHRVLSSATYRRTALGAVADTETFALEFEREHAEAFFAYDTFFPARGADGQYPLRFKRTFAQIKEYFRRQLDTYSKEIARAAGVPCFGALPGTYADYERGVGLPVMVIPTSKPPYNDDFTRSIRFYTTYLGVELDPEGRHYSRYDP